MLTISIYSCKTLTLVQLNWSQCWRLVPPNFCPLLPQHQARLLLYRSFSQNWEDSYFSTECFLAYPLIDLRCSFVSPLNCDSSFGGGKPCEFFLQLLCTCLALKNWYDGVLVNALVSIHQFLRCCSWVESVNFLQNCKFHFQVLGFTSFPRCSEW